MPLTDDQIREALRVCGEATGERWYVRFGRLYDNPVPVMVDVLSTEDLVEEQVDKNLLCAALCRNTLPKALQQLLEARKRIAELESELAQRGLVVKTKMTDRDRQIIETLARELMGWKDPRKTAASDIANWLAEKSNYPAFHEGYMRCGPGLPIEHWNPLTDWRAAGEVLETMCRRFYSSRKLPSGRADIWERFELYLTGHDKAYRTVGGLLNTLCPRYITEAAFEALTHGC